MSEDLVKSRLARTASAPKSEDPMKFSPTSFGVFLESPSAAAAVNLVWTEHWTQQLRVPSEVLSLNWVLQARAWPPCAVRFPSFQHHAQTPRVKRFSGSEEVCVDVYHCRKRAVTDLFSHGVLARSRVLLTCLHCDHFGAKAQLRVHLMVDSGLGREGVAQHEAPPHPRLVLAVHLLRPGRVRRLDCLGKVSETAGLILEEWPRWSGARFAVPDRVL